MAHVARPQDVSVPLVRVEGYLSIEQYELMCLPLRVAGADGAPARVVLRR